MSTNGLRAIIRGHESERASARGLGYNLDQVASAPPRAMVTVHTGCYKPSVRGSGIVRIHTDGSIDGVALHEEGAPSEQLVAAHVAGGSTGVFDCLALAFRLLCGRAR